MPLQIIYAGKTKASQPRGFVFPKKFCISQNTKHWSNEEETHKLIDSVIMPYVTQEKENLGLPPQQKALIVWDVFKGQTTEAVKNKLDLLSIEQVAVPANMTHFFQPLDLTVNKVAKNFIKKSYYSGVIQQGLQEGKDLENIEVDLRLSVIKPLHAQWLVNMYNFFSTPNGKETIHKGWKKAGIHGLIDGSTVLPPDNPFQDIYAS